ncbi:MAG TPA: CopD family protein, partial [Micromonospora sp.]
AFALTTLVGSRGDIRTVQNWVRGAGLAVVAGATAESLSLAAAYSGGESLAAAFSLSAVTTLATTPAGAAVALRVVGAVGLIVAGTLEAAPFHRRHAAPGLGRGRHATGDIASVVDHRVRTLGRRLLPEQPAAVAIDVPPARLTPEDLDDPDGPPVRLRARTARPVLLAVAVALLLGAHLFDGHTVSAGPRLLVALADLAHTTAAAVWVGGVLLLAVLLVTRARRGEPTGVTEMAARFALPATGAVAFAGGAGGVLAFLILDRPADLVTTTWGRVLLVKVALVGLVALIGLYNSRRVIPELDERDGETTRLLCRTVAVEAATMLAVLLTTAILVNSAI